MIGPFHAGEEVWWDAKQQEYTVLRCDPCGWGGWWIRMRARDGHETAAHHWNLERISPPPIMDNTIAYLPKRRGWVPVVYEGGLSDAAL